MAQTGGGYDSFVAPIVAGSVAYAACLRLHADNAHPMQCPVGGMVARNAKGVVQDLGPSSYAWPSRRRA